MTLQTTISSPTTNILQDRSLLVLTIDIIPSTWTHQHTVQIIRHKQRTSAKKETIGPATLTIDVLPSITTFLLAYAACHRENALVILGCAGDEVAVVYPRKGVGMERMVSGDVCNSRGGNVNPVEMEEALKLGVTELMDQCVSKSLLDADGKDGGGG